MDIASKSRAGRKGRQGNPDAEGGIDVRRMSDSEIHRLCVTEMAKDHEVASKYFAYLRDWGHELGTYDYDFLTVKRLD